MRMARVRAGLMALAAALALGVAVPVAAETPATALPANPPTCTAKTLGVSRASNPALAADCDTLLAIRSTLRVSGWIDYDAPRWRDHPYALNWSAHSPLRHWRAVTLGGAPLRVIGLDFSATRERVRVFDARTRRWAPGQPFTREWTLRGVIPTQLGHLTALETLDLGGSELTGSMPTQLGSLARLRTLDLSNNQLSGELPKGLRALPPTLATLRLAGNPFTGCIDERLRLAATNDLATLIQARGLSWCPVTAVPNDGALTPGATYQVSSDTIIVDVPAMGPRIQLFFLVAWESYQTGGTAYCFSDLNALEFVCLDGRTGDEWSRGTVEPQLRELNGPVADASESLVPPAGLQSVFDALAATARPVPPAP